MAELIEYSNGAYSRCLDTKLMENLRAPNGKNFCQEFPSPPHPHFGWSVVAPRSGSLLQREPANASMIADALRCKGYLPGAGVLLYASCAADPYAFLGLARELSSLLRDRVAGPTGPIWVD